jgi:ribosomal protein S18 acetylase RimI-like enzyme
LKLRTYHAVDFAAVEALWREAFPNDTKPHHAPSVTIPEKCRHQPDLFIVAEAEDRTIVGTVMAGYDGHRGWLYSVAVAKSHRRTGLGTDLIREAERRLIALGCFKINLQVRSSNTEVTAFYASLGYELEPIVSMGKRVFE